MQSLTSNGYLRAVAKNRHGALLLTQTHCVHIRHLPNNIVTTSTISAPIHNRTSNPTCIPIRSQRFSKPNAYRNERRRHLNTAVVDTADNANPPATTRPPVFSKPERGSKSFAAHLWDQSKAYGSFYKSGIKAIFANRKQAQEIRAHLAAKAGQTGEKNVGKLENIATLIEKRPTAVTRAQYQLLRRSEYDMVRVPLFGVLIVVFGEWLILVLPFAPYIQPLTCRLPGLVKGMRSKVEQRRKEAFRMGTKPPDTARLLQNVASQKDRPTAASMPEFWTKLVKNLTHEELYHLSSTLNLHSRLWETAGAGKSATSVLGTILQSRLARRLCYLTQDDILLQESDGASALLPDEVIMACEERGMDVLGKNEGELKIQLRRWLEKQKADSYSGKALLQMLFKR